MNEQVVFSLILISLPIISLIQKNKSASSFISEGVLGILIGAALFIKVDWFASLFGNWIFNWHIILGIYIILVSSIEFVRGVLKLLRSDKNCI